LALTLSKLHECNSPHVDKLGITLFPALTKGSGGVDNHCADQHDRQRRNERHLGSELSAIACVRKDKTEQQARNETADVGLPRNAHSGQEPNHEVYPEKNE